MSNSVPKGFNDLNLSQFLVGDFNHPGIDWETGATKSAGQDNNFNFLGTIRVCYFTQNVDSHTGIRGSDTPTLLELLFISARDNTDFIDIGAPLGDSDHAMINIGYRCTLEPAPDKI